jgi:hypothetical protein
MAEQDNTEADRLIDYLDNYHPRWWYEWADVRDIGELAKLFIVDTMRPRLDLDEGLVIVRRLKLRVIRNMAQPIINAALTAGLVSLPPPARIVPDNPPWLSLPEDAQDMLLGETIDMIQECAKDEAIERLNLMTEEEVRGWVETLGPTEEPDNG